MCNNIFDDKMEQEFILRKKALDKMILEGNTINHEGLHKDIKSLKKRTSTSIIHRGKNNDIREKYDS